MWIGFCSIYSLEGYVVRAKWKTTCRWIAEAIKMVSNENRKKRFSWPTLGTTEAWLFAKRSLPNINSLPLDWISYRRNRKSVSILIVRRNKKPSTSTHKFCLIATLTIAQNICGIISLCTQKIQLNMYGVSKWCNTIREREKKNKK